ncbi:MAG TPA: hypothetical protein VM492_13585 [Sumerlaeia bacterium]|nr:hypothetical protein [Sumerlaeia bacterium]
MKQGDRVVVVKARKRLVSLGRDCLYVSGRGRYDGVHRLSAVDKTPDADMLAVAVDGQSTIVAPRRSVWPLRCFEGIVKRGRIEVVPVDAAGRIMN